MDGPFRHRLGTIPGAGSMGSLQTAGSLWLLPAVYVNPCTPTHWIWMELRDSCQSRVGDQDRPTVTPGTEQGAAMESSVLSPCGCALPV